MNAWQFLRGMLGELSPGHRGMVVTWLLLAVCVLVMVGAQTGTGWHAVAGAAGGLAMFVLAGCLVLSSKRVQDWIKGNRR